MDELAQAQDNARPANSSKSDDRGQSLLDQARYVIEDGNPDKLARDRSFATRLKRDLDSLEGAESRPTKRRAVSQASSNETMDYQLEMPDARLIVPDAFSQREEGDRTVGRTPAWLRRSALGIESGLTWNERSEEEQLAFQRFGDWVHAYNFVNERMMDSIRNLTELQSVHERGFLVQFKRG